MTKAELIEENKRLEADLKQTILNAYNDKKELEKVNEMLTQTVLSALEDDKTFTREIDRLNDKIKVSKSHYASERKSFNSKIKELNNEKSFKRDCDLDYLKAKVVGLTSTITEKESEFNTCIIKLVKKIR